MQKSKNYFCFLLMLVLFCFLENIALADDLKDLEYDKNRVNTLLRIGQNEKEW